MPTVLAVKGVFILHPNVQNVGLIDFDLIDVCLEVGTQAAQTALPQIEKIIALSLKLRARRAWRSIRRALHVESRETGI